MRPLLPFFLAWRQKQGKEDALRMKERMGLAGAPRPSAKLLWFHAASVGESQAALTLMRALREKHPDAPMLLTTITTTAAKMVKPLMPSKATHQYAPLDHPLYWKRFLDHWRPSLVLLMESEIWPNMMRALKARAIPTALINGRFSPVSEKNWEKFPKSAAFLFSQCDPALAQNAKTARVLKKMGAKNVRITGNLKEDAPPLPADEKDMAQWKEALASRPVFLAASTHRGEEESVLEAHRAAKEAAPQLLTIIAPRHPERGADLAKMARAAKLSYLRRGESQKIPEKETELYIADTIGELGLFYRLASITFMGGSLIPHGGQNALEAAHFGNALLFGEHVFNFTDLYDTLLLKEAALPISSPCHLGSTLVKLLGDRAWTARLADNAQRCAQEKRGALQKTLDAIDEMGVF